MSAETNDAIRKYDLYSHDFKLAAFETFARMRRDDPVHRQAGLDGSTPIWFVTRHAEADRILRDDRRFTRDPGRAGLSFPKGPIDGLLNDHMLNRDGEDHRRLRGLVQQAFTPRRVAAMRPRIEAITNALLDEVAARGEMDLVGDFAFPLPTVVILEMLGIPPEDRNLFREWSNALLSPPVTPEAQAEAMRQLGAFTEYLRELFARRRSDPRDDLLSALLRAEEQGDRLSEGELFSTMILLIVAGHETTVNLITNGTLALLRDPDAREEFERLLAAGDDAGVQAAVEELLRYDGPVERAIVRWATEDVEVAGHRIARGDSVIVILSAANRDEAVFERPDELELSRRATAHLGFGKGAHYCLGAPLARLEAAVALSALVSRLPRLELAVSGGELRYRDLPGFKALESLPVRWVPGAAGDPA